MRVLVIEPARASRELVRDHLTGFQVQDAATVAAAAGTDASHFAAIVANAELLDNAGALMTFAGGTPVVLVADAPSVPHAVDCMRRGAADYLPKPLAAGALAAALQRSIGNAAPPRAPRLGFSNILGDSQPMRDLFDAILALGKSDCAVLVRGESGTGKTLVAHALHAASKHRSGPLISLDCAAVPATTIESDLFGSTFDNNGIAAPSAGSLTAAARDGTLFLHAVEELPMDAQATLARFLDATNAHPAAQPRGVGDLPDERDGESADVRWIAATRADLPRLASHGHFRSDLLALLSASTLLVPPLRDRADDATTIATAVLDRTAAKLGKSGVRFSPTALAAMGSYAWPGNVRELENAVERATALARTTTIDADQLGLGAAAIACSFPSLAPSPSPASPPTPAPATAANTGETLSTSGSLESFFVRFVLDNQDQLTETELASRLGISRKSLWERRQRLNIPRRRTRKRGPRRQ